MPQLEETWQRACLTLLHTTKHPTNPPAKIDPSPPPPRAWHREIKEALMPYCGVHCLKFAIFAAPSACFSIIQPNQLIGTHPPPHDTQVRVAYTEGASADTTSVIL